MKRLDTLRDLIGRHVDQSRQKREKYYNKGRRDVRFNVGDKTHFLSDAVKKFNAKLAPKFEGPFEIIEILSPTVYVLGQGEESNRRIAKVHVSELKRYLPPRARGNRDKE